MSEFLTLPGDVVFKEVHPERPLEPKEYFDCYVRCGDINNDTPRKDGLPLRAWERTHSTNGCGAADWNVKQAFWYPRPGKQFELECRRCGRFSGVEVREPINADRP